jgi:hypothetical protein
MTSKKLVAVAALAVTAALPFAAEAAPKQGPKAAPSASCSVLPGNVVQAQGLPTGEVINFMVADSSGSWGWVLGYTDSGDWTVSVPAPSGPTVYEFVSRTFGSNGSKYNVYASCSA